MYVSVTFLAAKSESLALQALSTNMEPDPYWLGIEPWPPSMIQSSNPH